MKRKRDRNPVLTVMPWLLTGRECSMEKTKKPIVSVVIPVYNVDPYLEECLNSVVHQTLQNIEIICVNDGSTDTSPAILHRYADEDNRILIIDQENQGLSGARNSGAKAATGKYLYFLDSDDFLDHEALKLCVEEMERRNLEFLCFNMAAFGNDPETARYAGDINYRYFKRTLDDEKCYTGPELFAELKQKGAYIAPAQSCMVRTDAFLEHGLWFHPGILHEDEPWTFIVLMSLSRCGCLNRILYQYRIRSNSITQGGVTFAHTYGLFSGLMDMEQMIRANPQLLQDEQAGDIIAAHVLHHQKNTVKKYLLCSKEEQDGWENLDAPERFYFQQMVVNPALLTEKEETNKKEITEYRDTLAILNRKTMSLKQKNKKFSAEIRHLKNSKSWRIGRIMTLLPRKGKSFLARISKRINRAKKKKTITRPAAVTNETRKSSGNVLNILPSEVSGKHVLFRYNVSGEWASCFMTQEPFEITYPFDMESVPESIRIIPFLSQVLPVSWVWDAEIRVPVCDQDFYNCLEDVKAGYRKMYPMISFGGKLTAESVEENRKPEQEQNTLACFSGGVDALSTTIAHLAENPLLVSLWGSDVPSEDEENWKPVEALIRKNAEVLGLETMTVRTSFRKLLSFKILSQKVKVTGDNWWHGFQHGLGILGHMAPVAWHEMKGTVYIASSFTAKDHYTCASDPIIDNFIRFCGARVFHDGYDLNRQEKIRKIVDYSRENNQQILMHVCWEKRGGDNCCHCEKCWRTMLGLYAEGADPKQYGFSLFDGIDGFSGDIERDFQPFWILAEANYLPIQRRLSESLAQENVPSGLTWFMQADLSKIQDGSFVLREGKLVRQAWLLGTPNHRNMGDHCIAEEEIRFLHSIMPDGRIIEVSEAELKKKHFSQLVRIPSSQPVFLHGGGNLGTIWPDQENLRSKIINRLKGHSIVIFPQSIHFDEGEAGRKALDDAGKVYQGEQILLCCRDNVSYQFAQEHFACRSILVPDMVLWESKTKGNQRERFGAMTLLRQDIERKLGDEDHTMIETILAERFRSLDSFDTVLRKGKVTRENRTEKIDDLICRISGAECVVTDRLHGMILCAVTETPCVVLPNGNQKVEACFEWVKSLGYIRFIHRTDELADAVEEVCGCTERIYPEKEMRECYGELIRSIAGRPIGDGFSGEDVLLQ